MTKALILQITEFTCESCGNRWTHSQLILRSTERGVHGYTYSINDLPTYEWHRKRGLEVSGFLNGKDLRPKCHRCIPLELGHGWQKAGVDETFLQQPPEAEWTGTVPNPNEGLARATPSKRASKTTAGKPSVSTSIMKDILE